jgi:hypothetical protein
VFLLLCCAGFLQKLNPAGIFMEKLKIKIEEWIDEFLDMFVSRAT